jgi:outer membrane immunogenic protein
LIVRTVKTILLIACLGAGLAQAAHATEFVFPATAPQSQGPNWAGFYLHNNDSGSGSTGVPWTTLATPNGFSSAGTATPAVSDSFGYNFQAGNFVFGLEGSLAAANFDGRFTAPTAAPYMSAGGAWTPNMSWLGTVTGRVGYSFGQWFPYMKGGFASAGMASPLGGPAIGSFSQTSEVAGWTAGVGVEYQLTPKWSLGLEYLYTDLGNGASGGAPIGIGIGGTGPEVYSTALKTQSLLGRLNYKVGW